MYLQVKYVLAAIMQTLPTDKVSLSDTFLKYVRVRRYSESWLANVVLHRLSQQMCASTATNPDQILGGVIGLVKKIDKIDASKFTETADFQKDLNLDSLDRVELVMVFKEEISIEIPEEKADKLTCCADTAKHMAEEKPVKS